jgi:hypothetical protein
MPERPPAHFLFILRQVLCRKNEKRMFKPEIINLIETCITDRAECDPGHSGKLRQAAALNCLYHV